ncbi:hypothetical protein Cgig2_010810 [Carnegiea gigantea]|uniref:Uncharacterized protein n=1 Tax=Carnegiea gigantea TaxID=171969 RepID=A0A9Q1JPZ2_9CARY|nr:hypothetical protein Cgig2_010810 [Carnegiea gigantea]
MTPVFGALAHATPQASRPHLEALYKRLPGAALGVRSAQQPPRPQPAHSSGIRPESPSGEVTGAGNPTPVPLKVADNVLSHLLGWNTPSSVVAFYTCEEGRFLRPLSKSRNLPNYGWWRRAIRYKGPISKAPGMYVGYGQFSIFYLTTPLARYANARYKPYIEEVKKDVNVRKSLSFVIHEDGSLRFKR